MKWRGAGINVTECEHVVWCYHRVFGFILFSFMNLIFLNLSIPKRRLLCRTTSRCPNFRTWGKGAIWIPGSREERRTAFTKQRLCCGNLSGPPRVGRLKPYKGWRNNAKARSAYVTRGRWSQNHIRADGARRHYVSTLRQQCRGLRMIRHQE